ncbi:lysophospholipid acyltransferase family protein [Limibacterium fermenti]|uniref:lysophospholipid acyltransferase family protein n=1 Tax=Limibacterium fermenti TaxID=3229863 RepID=UPI000E957C2D|nr:1-acyl-sn-glycerol-3-phosphate acyltransferase [Porphyromonadaceae bacterium]HBX46195.1 1-acyl-sn-glycerol-3-phosphate acyltransferase [Porphyromonadaceae bacterium]
MKFLKKGLCFVYQWIVFVPLFIISTFMTALTVMIFAPVFGSKFWGYYPPKWWSKITCRLALCRIKVRGREHLDPNQSYVFIANHQGAFDIFLVYGYLNQNIKWVQKKSLRNIPFVGFASEMAGHVFVDNSSPGARAKTIFQAQRKIVDGVSIMLFPEGSRTHTGKMGRFRRGAFQIAYDMKLPVVPLTLNGPFDVMSRNTLLFTPGTLELVIHPPIPTESLSETDIPQLVERSKEIIQEALWEKYK